MATTQQPTHRAFVVVKREGGDDFWINVGAAFPHADGKGYNVIVQALPIDGKIVLRIPQEEPEQNSGRERSRTAPAKSGSRRR
jgi:hypothetical protein